MGESWQHPSLGEFVWSPGGRWKKKKPLTDGVAFLLATEQFDPTPPSIAASQLAEDVAASRDRYLSGSYDYLWGALCGNHTNHRYEHIESRPPSKDGMVRQLSLYELAVRYIPEQTATSAVVNPFTQEAVSVDPPLISRPAFWTVELTFHAVFEEEHGVAVLWHDNLPISCGFASDVWPPNDYSPTGDRTNG